MSTDEQGFGRLQAFARKVAVELSSSGRPTDTVRSGHTSIDGWIVWKADMLVRTRRGKDGYVGWYTTRVEWDSVWLAVVGSLHRVETVAEINASNLAPRATPAVRNTATSQISELTIDEALMISGHPPWRERRFREGGVEVFEGYRLPHRARGDVPCLGMSKMLADLRAGKSGSNIVTSYG